jgi:hypothetical protein
VPVVFNLTYVLQLVIDKNLATLPRRKTDNAIIIRSQDSDVAKARVFKLNAVAGEPILLERHVNFISFVQTIEIRAGTADMNASTDFIVHGVP